MQLSKHAQLSAWLTNDIARRGIPCNLETLEEQAERSIERHLAQSKRLRPSAVAKELARLAKHLGAAKVAAERLGDHGLLHILVASGGNIDDHAVLMTTHVGYLETMAAWSQTAAVTARELSASAEDYRGGPTPNRELRALIAELMLTYERVLRVRATHTVHKESHVAERGFTGFVKEAPCCMDERVGNRGWIAWRPVWLPSKDLPCRSRPMPLAVTAFPDSGTR